MTSKDDPFGPADKTIIRIDRSNSPPEPSAAVRRVTLNKTRDLANQTVFDPSASLRSQSPLPDGTVLYQGALFQEGPVPDASDPALSGAIPASPAVPQDLPAEHPANYPARNPLVAAAAPILILLGQLRTHAVQPDATLLAERLKTLVSSFETRLAAADTREADARIARFVLCESIDDIVSNLPGLGGDGWLQHSLVRHFFNVDFTGAGTFQALNKVLEKPEDHLDLIEMILACLSLGFEGQYRRTARSDGLFDKVRNDVYETLRYFRPRPEPDLSPRWTSFSAATEKTPMRLPVWAFAAAACTLVVALFFGLRTIITNDGDALAAELLSLNPSTPVMIARSDVTPIAESRPAEVVAPPDDNSQLERIRAALQDEIKSGDLTVGTKGDFIVIEVSNLVLFDAGRAIAKPEFDPIAARIAAALSAEPGPLKIVGHTDNVKPTKTSTFKSNYDLSIARANAVEKVLAAKIADASRIAVEGKGEDEPVADNATPEGRAKNRRVDLLVRREQTL